LPSIKFSSNLIQRQPFVTEIVHAPEKQTMKWFPQSIAHDGFVRLDDKVPLNLWRDCEVFSLSSVPSF